MAFDADTLDEALATLGEVLDSRQLHFEVVAIGGGALLLLGVLERPTKDLDIVALLNGGELATSEPFPEALAVACADVARAMGLPPGWMNAGPTALFELGYLLALPPERGDATTVPALSSTSRAGSTRSISSSTQLSTMDLTASTFRTSGNWRRRQVSFVSPRAGPSLTTLRQPFATCAVKF